jgi:hypothetical protein
MRHYRLTVCALVCALLTLPALASAQITATFLQTAEDATDGSAFSYTAQNFGAAAADRYITVISFARKSGAATCTAPTVTIGGVTATAVTSAGNNSVNCNITAIHKALVPTGTSGTIALTYGATILSQQIAVYRSTGAQAITASDSGTSTATDPTGTLTIGATGYGIGGSITTSAGATATWTGLTETSDAVLATGSTSHASSALLTPGTAQDDLVVTVDWTAASESVGVWASWTPIVNASSPTHYVTPTGNDASGSCTIGDPCSLRRAFNLAGGTMMPAGSWVDVAAGVYSQAAITPTGNGGALGYPVRFVGAGTGSGETQITGTRTSLPAAAWTQTTDVTGCGGLCDYTFQTPFDNTALYTVELVAQRPGPLMTTWVPILVESRSPTSGWAPTGRAYDLDEPIRYTSQTSIASVELQHCTFYHNTTTDILYIHPCREATPSDADQYYAGSQGWGTILFDGDQDYVTLEQMSIEHTAGGSRGVQIDRNAVGIQLHHLKFLSSMLWAKGNATYGTHLLLKEHMNQGPPHANCYGPDYGGNGLNSRSCWSFNTAGTSEYSILIGQEGVVGLNQVFDYVTMERAWNGYIISGPATLNHAVCWGLDNHCGQANGDGVVITNGIFENSQDSLYYEGESFDDHVIEHNIFRNGTLFWCSRDGNTQGGVTCPTTWSFRYNVVGSLVTDRITEPSLVSDCNVWMPRNAGSTIFRITQVDGTGSDPQYTTLAQLQAGTTQDDNSVFYDYPAFVDGSVFTSVGQEDYPPAYEFATGGQDLATVCGEVAGPDTLVEEEEETPVGPSRLRFRVP